MWEQIVVNYPVSCFTFLTVLDKKFTHLLISFGWQCIASTIEMIYYIHHFTVYAAFSLIILKAREGLFIIQHLPITATSVTRENGVLNPDKILHNHI